MKCTLSIGELIDGHFTVKVDGRRGQALIYPQKGKPSWKFKELKYRSIVVDNMGQIVSMSFPKFFNLFEYVQGSCPLELPIHEHVPIEEYRENFIVRFFEKADGTLIIRDVHDGVVNFRTRGTLTFSEPKEQVKEWEALCERHPLLLDPFWNPHQSTLFEYVSPKNRIVLGYNKPEAIFLGGISKLNGEYFPSCEYGNQGFPIPVMHSFSGTLAEIQREISEMKGREGFVAMIRSRTSGACWFVKLKTREYVEEHRVRSHWTVKRMGFLLCLLNDSVTDYYQQLAPLGIDAECVSADFPDLVSKMKSFFIYRTAVEDVQRNVALPKFAEMDQKSFAEWVNSAITKGMQPAYFMLRRDNSDKTVETLLFNKALNLFPVSREEIPELRKLLDESRQ